MAEKEKYGIDDMEEYDALLKKEEQESQKSLQELNLEKLDEYHRTKDEDLRNEIVTDNMRMVYNIARSYVKKWPGISFEDFVQEGALGLMNAVNNFDPSYHVMFSTFAFPYIKSGMNRCIQQQTHIISVPANVQNRLNRYNAAVDRLFVKLERQPTDSEVAKELSIDEKEVGELRNYSMSVISSDVTNPSGDDVNIQDFYPDDSKDPSELCKDKETYEFFLEVLQSLDERKREIYKRRHGIGCRKETLNEIHSDFHVSLQRVAQLENEAENEIRRKMKDYLK